MNIHQYLYLIPEHEKLFYHNCIAVLPSEEKKLLIELCVRATKDHVVQSKRLIEKKILSPICELEREIYSFYVLPDYPHLARKLIKISIQYKREQRNSKQSYQDRLRKLFT
jgi:hypothetical protein